MVSEPTIRPSTDELVYRAKHYHDLAAIRNRRLTCASCGSKLDVETEKVFSHPVIGTLQCKDCWDQLKHINFSVKDAAEKHCRLCGHSKKLYVCGRANCPYTFCKKCIKRNVSIFPISPEEDNWECFICNPKPFWALRAICAVVMESKRNKRKSASHVNDLSLPSVRRKLVQAKRMQKSLQSLCDKEEDDSTTAARPLFSNKRRGSNEKALKLYTMDTTDSSEDEERNIKNSTSRKYRTVESDSSLEGESLKSFIVDDSNSEEEREKCTQNPKKVTCSKSSSTLDKKKLSKSRLMSEIKNLDSDSEEEGIENGKEKNSRHIGSGKASAKEKMAAVRGKNTSKQENRKSEESLKECNIESCESETENSSSGKEFQKSKLFRSNHKSLKRVNDDEEEYERSKKLLLLKTNKYPIDKKQNVYFKTHVSEFLDEFKQICSESGLHMAYIKYKYCRKQLLNQDNAKHLILKFHSIINKLKIELNKQQEDLISFYDLWYKKCGSEHVSETKSVNDVEEKHSSSNDEAHRAKNYCKRKSTNLTSQVPGEDNDVVSECDSKEIFSDEEMIKDSTEGNINTRKKNRFEEEDDRDTITKSNVEHVVNRVLNSPEIKDTEERSAAKDDERTESTSPILGSIKAKKNVESNSKSTRNDIVKRTDFNRKTVQDDTKSDDSSHVFENSHANEKNSTIADTNKSLSKIVDCNNEVDEVDESLNDIFDTSFEMEAVTDHHNSTACSEDEKTETNGLQLIGTNMNSANKDIENKTETVSKSSDEKCVDDAEHGKSMKAQKQGDTIENPTKEGQCESSAEDVTQKLPRDNDDKLSDDDSNNIDVEETNDISEDLLESEERAKRTMLATDSESSGQEGNTETNVRTEKPTKKSSLEDDKAENKNSDADSNCSTIVLSESKKNERKQGKKSKGKSSKEHKGKIHNFSNDGDSTDLESNDSSNSSSKIKENGKKKDEISENEDDSDNLRAKKALLTSSNSETSSSDQGSKSLSIDFVNSETDTSSKISVLRNPGLESDTSVGSRVKRRRLMLSKNKYYMNDKKLRMNCRVIIIRLQKKVLEKYATALERSRQRLDYKTFKSLINLDNLKRSHKRNSANDTDSTKPSKDLKKNTQKNKIAENSSLDDLTKAENDEITTIVDEDSNGETNQQLKDVPVSNEEIVSEADRVAKNNLLNSSDSSIDLDIELDKSDEDKSVKNKKSVKKEKKKCEKGEENCSDDDEEAQQKRAKSSWRKNKLLTEDILNSDTDVEQEKWLKSQEKVKVEEEEGDGPNSNSKNTSSKRKKNNRRRIPSSDSDSNPAFPSDSDSSEKATSNEEKKNSSDERQKQKQKKKTRKRNNSASSNTDSESAEKSKPKRKRIKKMPSDSDSDSEPKNSQGTPGKSGRKNIRKVLKDKQVAEDTKQAAKEEEERLKRIAERQKLYNEMYEMRLAGEEKVDKLVLDFNTETKEELISVHKEIVKRLKPHQAQGIKFMWDACFESLERIKRTPGSGCIIAHCMGLGKTLQVIGLIHTLLTHESTGMKTAMVVCPLSTVLNWVNEFNMWLSDVNNGDNEDVEIFELTKYKKNFQRRYLLEEWQRTGGVLVIGYEMFRNLTGPCKGVRKNVKEVILQCLIDPGPDIIVCDEGHLLKNEDTALSKCMKRVKTLRRIVLTGTPLQNNLIEYHCMVQFVKPNLLGTRREFLNRFVNPITNGQFDNSTPYDVTLMKKRAHVLHKMLEGCVQRFDYSVLTPFLPPKQEYVIFVRLTEVQVKMYKYYLDNLARRQTGAGGSLFSDFQALQRIWTHPTVLRLNAEKIEKANEKKFITDSESSISNYDTSEGTTSDSSDSDVEAIDNPLKQGQSKRRTRNNSGGDNPLSETEEPAEKEWWAQFVEPDDFKDMRISAKLILLFGILKECEQIGDKVLVFSQSLYSLSLIEEFLEEIDKSGDTSSEYLEGHTGSWTLDLDYFRLDGQSSAENRSLWCKLFNNPSNMRARLFLISTRAGGLGINLTAANRVIIFDASWNPSHDVQSIFRVYRFGQKKPCYVYRFLASGTMEEKIYNRQVTKLSLSCRVVDEQQIERHYSNNDLSELYKFEQRYTSDDERPTLNLPKDRLLAEIVSKYKDYVENYHEHDSLLENKAEEELNEEDRKQAWLEYEEEKKGKPPQQNLMTSPYSHGVLLHQYNMLTNQAIVGSPNASMQIDYENLQQLIRKDYPNATPEQQKLITTRALHYMYSYWEKQAVLQPAASSMMGQQRGGPNTPIILDSQRPQQQTNYSGLNRNSFVPTNASTSNTVDDDVIEIETSTGNAANTILPPVQSILQSTLMSDSKEN